MVITLTEDLYDEYLDEKGKVVLSEYYLEDVTAIPSPQSSTVVAPSDEKPIHFLAKSMLLEKFAETSITNFVSECRRLNMHGDKYAETMRLFSVASASGW